MRELPAVWNHDGQYRVKCRDTSLNQGGTAEFPSLALAMDGFFIAICMGGTAMMSLEELRSFAPSFSTMPVYRTLYADMCTPVGVLRLLRHISRQCYLLESMEDSGRWGRYTFLGCDPELELIAKSGSIEMHTGATVIRKQGSVQDVIREILDENKAPKLSELPPFTGGLVGFFAYEYAGCVEKALTFHSEDDEEVPDVDLLLFNKVIVFDHLKQKIFLIANVKLDSAEENYHKAASELEMLEKLILNGKMAAPDPFSMDEPLEELFTEEEYCRMVEETKHYIHEGDIFQAVISNRLSAPAHGSLLDVYRALRTTNPSPYLFYFSSAKIEIAGSSPETLTRLNDGRLFTFPLAGTRPRGHTPSEDDALERELRSDPKELAEHNMLVDLGRNDLGRISEFGTVKVEKLHEILKFSQVMHIGSTVSGVIRDGMTAIDAIGSVLPAGTLSGAPKLRAMQIIDELEGHRRGVYGGAVGYLDFTGNMDVCIGIRLAYKIGGRVYVKAGAGIVADSVPEKEYQECCNKARAVVLALKEAAGGLDYESDNR